MSHTGTHPEDSEMDGSHARTEQGSHHSVSSTVPPFLTGPCSPWGLPSHRLRSMGAAVSVTNPSSPLPLPWQPFGAKGPVLVFPGAPPPVLAVVVVGTGIALATQSWRLLARLCLIVAQDVSSLCTEGQRAEGRGQSPPTTAE